MSVAIVIPARLQSTRLPQKLLLDLGGRCVIQRTYEQALKSKRAQCVVIATDAEEIAAAARGIGARVIMTRSDHQSGTERIAEAARLIDADTIINIQGDEPEIDPAHIDALIDAHFLAGCFASTLACPFPAAIDPAYPAAVKAVLGNELSREYPIYEAKDFSRIPPVGEPLFLHVGAYAYGRDSLARFVSAPRGKREAAESLEQLRILEMGETIAIRIIDHSARGIDTQADYEESRARFSRKI